MTPFEVVEKGFTDALRDGAPKPKWITLPALHAEMFLRQAMQIKPWYVTMKPGKITYRGARLRVVSDADFKKLQEQYKRDHPIEVPEAPKIILPGQLERV